MSKKTLISITRRTGWIGLLLLTSLTARAASFQSVSRPDPTFPSSASGGSDSVLPIISADGGYVLFASTAGNLAMISNTIPTAPPLPRPLNVFLRDRTNASTTLISANISGLSGGNGDSLPGGISANGQFGLFESSASNLTPGDTNNASDIFVRNLSAGTNILVSVSTNGSSGNGNSYSATMTPDGRFIAFVSTANNLVAGDTNKIPDVFVRDLQTATTTLISVGAIATNFTAATPSASSDSPVITPDGRYVAFFSTATNLVPGVRTVGDVYVRDTLAGTTAWASVNARAIFFTTVGTSNAFACNHSLSDDGQFVGFVASTNLASSTSARGIALRHNLQSGITDIVHTNARATSLTVEEINNLDMTPDGRFIAFIANVTGFTGADSAIYLWDAQSGLNTLISVNTNGTATANAICDSIAVSTNGQFVAFISTANNLTTNALAGEFHFYHRDVMAGLTKLVDVDLNGSGGGVNFYAAPTMSADGNLVTLESDTTNLATNDSNHSSDIFVRNISTATTELISARHPALPSTSPTGTSGAFLYSVSASGRFVSFASDANDLVTNDTNGLRDIFVRDLLTNSNTLVSVGTNGFAGAGLSTEPTISSDGRYVAFTSYATNLTATDPNTTQDVFIRDLQTSTTTLVSVSTDGVNPGNRDSYQPTLGTDGRYVLYRSKSANLAAGSFGSSIENLFLRDRQLGTNYPLTTGGLTAVSATPDARLIAYIDPAGSSAGQIYVWNSQLATRSTNTSVATVTNVAISPDGSKLAVFGNGGLRVINRAANTNALIATGTLSPRPGFQFSTDGRFLTYALTGTNQVFLYDAGSNTSLLVSKAFNSSLGGNAGSDSSTISADGRFVIYRSAATNIVANDTNDFPDLFVYDRLTGTNSLLTQSRFGNFAADNRSRTPVFSSNGRAVIFQSWASDLSAGDFNQLGDLFSFEFLYVDLTSENLPAGGKILSWPAAPGETYHAQYRDDVSDPNWQDLVAPISITGNRAYLTNAPPIPDQRFYRVIAE